MFRKCWLHGGRSLLTDQPHANCSYSSSKSSSQDTPSSPDLESFMAQSHSQQHDLTQIQSMTAFQGQMQGTRYAPASWLTGQEDGDRLRDPVRGTQPLVTRAPPTCFLAQTPVLSGPWSQELESTQSPVMAQPQAKDGSGTAPLYVSVSQMRPFGQEAHLPPLSPKPGT